MATIGQVLKAAREQKGVTASQAAAATHMKVQVVEALERDDYSRIAAPMYVRGFLKLYGEYLGLDPAPLIREYMELHSPKDRPPLVSQEAPPSDSATERKKIEIDGSRLKAFFDKVKKPVAVGLGVIVLVVAAVNGITRCSRRITEPRQAAAPAASEKKTPLPVLREPPDPYIEIPTPGRPNP